MLSGACFTASLAAFWNSGELISFSADSTDGGEVVLPLEERDEAVPRGLAPEE